MLRGNARAGGRPRDRDPRPGRPRGASLVRRHLDRRGLSDTPRRTLRAFVAVPLAPECREDLAEHAARLAALPWGGDVRWVRTENLHLTLRFLGEISAGRIAPLIRTLTRGLARVSAFDCQIRGVQLFPSSRRARVVAAVIEHEERLSRLAAIAESAVVAAGFAPETRRLRAHVTLGRARKPPLRGVAVEPAATLTLAVRHVALYRSELGVAGSRYTELGRVELRTRPNGDLER